MAESLKSKTIRGTFWSAADSFLGQGVTFLVGIVLARLLSPTEYGLIGIALIFTIVLSGVVDSGFSTAIIRKKIATEEDYNTMFLTNMGMSILLYFVLYLLSPLISDFFVRPELTPVIRAMGLILIFQALSITQVTILTKRIDFKTKTKASIISAIASGVIGIVMALMGHGVWALVGQKLSNTLLYSICLWIFNRWWPNGTFSRNSFHYMWDFGWKLMLSGLLESIWGQLYQVVIGKCYTPATLGQYSRSNEYAFIVSAHFTSIIQRVTYPVLAEVQDEKERMIAAYRKIIKITMFVIFLLMSFMGAAAEPFVYCLIGPKWHEASTYLPLICVSMSLYPLHAINLNMLKVQGRSDIYFYLEIIKKIIGIGPLCLGIFVGIYWMIAGSIVTSIVSFFLNSYYTGKRLHYSSWMQLHDIAPSIVLALAIAVVVFPLKYLSMSYWLILPLQVLVYILMFIVICETTKMAEYIELKSIVQKAIYKV